MKMYNRPEIFVTEFVPNHSISSCPTTETYNEVTVDCVVTGSHDIFYTGCDENYNNLTIVTNFWNSATTKNDYLLWGGTADNYTGQVFDASSSAYTGYSGHDATSAFTGTGHSLLDKLMEIVVKQKDDDDMGPKDVHGGMISPDIVKTRNSSL